MSENIKIVLWIHIDCVNTARHKGQLTSAESERARTLQRKGRGRKKKKELEGLRNGFETFKTCFSLAYIQHRILKEREVGSLTGTQSEQQIRIQHFTHNANQGVQNMYAADSRRGKCAVKVPFVLSMLVFAVVWWQTVGVNMVCEACSFNQR